jgi:hypothetical protein
MSIVADKALKESVRSMQYQQAAFTGLSTRE